jgi:Fe2+ or Zn2+ uptake regulation protein
VDYLDKYVDILRKNNIKITPQRLIILKYLDRNYTHPTTEKIFSDLKSSNPSLSKTTVYNSLEILKEHGIIQSITISGSELRYDLNHGMHHHFFCKKCGEVIDIALECPNVEKMSEFGHQVEEIHGYIKGICKKCLNRDKK